MTDINSNKHGIIIQPITLQIRAPFRFLTNQRAIKHAHYSESRDGLNGRCSFSVCVCVRQESTLLDSFFLHKGCKVEQISPLFHLYLYLFSKFRRAPVYPCQPGMPSTVQISTQSTAVGLWLRRRNRPFRFRCCFLSSFKSNIYTRERLLLVKSAKQSEGKGVSRSQLQCQATTALIKNYVHLNRAGVIEVNVCERQ